MGRGVPKEGPGSLKEPLVLHGIDMMCPKCKGTDNLWRNEHVLRSVGIRPLEEGGFDWNDLDDVCWDTSCHNPEEPEFFCRDCDMYFDAPDIAELDGNADQVRSKEDAQIHQGA